MALKKASPEFIKEFVASSPSYPLLLLCEKSDASYKAWRDLPRLDVEEQKKIIARLLEDCRSEDILNQCRSRIEESLVLAANHIETLGASPTLKAILEQLHIRAEDALGGEKLL